MSPLVMPQRSIRPLLQHIHIRGLTPYPQIVALQSKLVAQHLLHKASPTTNLAPSPTIISFTPPPVYTFGRRSPPSLLAPEEIEKLKEPLDDHHGGLRLGANIDKPWEEIETNGERITINAEVEASQRGGLTTFHGPGQLVIFPILDLKGPTIVHQEGGSFEKTGLDVRSYVDLLENSTIQFLKSEYGITAKRTENPGVWVDVANTEERAKPDGKIKALEMQLVRQMHGKMGYEAVDKKIAALGVHLRRNITSFGLAINHSTDLRWFERITPCGLEGKGVTSIQEMHCRTKYGIMRRMAGEREDLQANVAQAWTRRFVSGIWGVSENWEEPTDVFWDRFITSRVWGQHRYGDSKEATGLEQVDQAMLDSIGVWPVPEPGNERPWYFKRPIERPVLRHKRSIKLIEQSVLHWLDEEIREIKKQIEGKELKKSDVQRILERLRSGWVAKKLEETTKVKQKNIDWNKGGKHSGRLPQRAQYYPDYIPFQ